MSGAYVVCGLLIGLMAGRLSLAEPYWWMLIIPAGAAFFAASELEKRK